MKFLPSGDHYELSSGRRFYANSGILGLGPDADWIYEGYDGSVSTGRASLTPSEVAEIADFMIEQWQRLKANAEAGMVING